MTQTTSALIDPDQLRRAVAELGGGEEAWQRASNPAVIEQLAGILTDTMTAIRRPPSQIMRRAISPQVRIRAIQAHVDSTSMDTRGLDFSLANIVKDDPSQEVRLAALAQTQRQKSLLRVAKSNDNAEVRLAAIHRLDQGDLIFFLSDVDPDEMPGTYQAAIDLLDEDLISDREELREKIAAFRARTE